MSVQSLQAFRFVHPDVGEENGSTGLVVKQQGSIDVVRNSDSIRQSVVMVLSTMPGERVMRPEYGCDLYKLIFSPNDDTTHGLAIHYVRRALAKWEPRVKIMQLDVVKSPLADECIQITLGYMVLLTREIEDLTFSLDLQERRES